MEATPEPPARGDRHPHRPRQALGRAELLAKEFPDGWVYIHLEYRREKE
jgi:hypothetical protein